MAELKVKMPCGGTVTPIMSNGKVEKGTYICTMGHEHSSEEIQKVMNEEKYNKKKNKDA